jgi:hypothetical protein
MMEPSYLLDNIGAELLDRKCADVADELTNDGITKPVIIEVENVLDNLTKYTSETSSFRGINNLHSCRKDPALESRHCM